MDTARWQAALEDHVRTHSFDAVVESALADPEELQHLRGRPPADQAPSRDRGGGDGRGVESARGPGPLPVRGPHCGGRYVGWQNHDQLPPRVGFSQPTVCPLPLAAGRYAWPVSPLSRAA